MTDPNENPFSHMTEEEEAEVLDLLLNPARSDELHNLMLENAADVLLDPAQTRRFLSAVGEEGAAGVIHSMASSASITENQKPVESIKLTEMDSIPAGSNPFHHDAYNMGTPTLSGSWCLMFDEHTGNENEPAYLILINQQTGRRFRLDLDAFNKEHRIGKYRPTEDRDEEE